MTSKSQRGGLFSPPRGQHVEHAGSVESRLDAGLSGLTDAQFVKRANFGGLGRYPCEVIGQRAVEAHVGTALLLGVRFVQQPDGQLRLAGACGGVDDERAAGVLDLGNPGGQAG